MIFLKKIEFLEFLIFCEDEELIPDCIFVGPDSHVIDFQLIYDQIGAERQFRLPVRRPRKSIRSAANRRHTPNAAHILPLFVHSGDFDHIFLQKKIQNFTSKKTKKSRNQTQKTLTRSPS